MILLVLVLENPRKIEDEDDENDDGCPRVARAAQPWAGRRNPFGIGRIATVITEALACFLLGNRCGMFEFSFAAGPHGREADGFVDAIRPAIIRVGGKRPDPILSMGEVDVHGGHGGGDVWRSEFHASQ